MLSVCFSSSAPIPNITLEVNGTQFVGTRLEANCFVELPSADLAPYITIDFLDSVFSNVSSQLELFPQERSQLLPTRRYNETHFVRTIIVDPLTIEDQNVYYCVANFSGPYLISLGAVQPVFLQVFGNFSLNKLLDE